MILVTSAYGNQGRLLVPKLLAAGRRVRTWASTASSASALEQLGVKEVITADLMESAATRVALQDVETVFHIGPNAHPDEDAVGCAIIEAAKGAGVRHFVFSSVLHPQIGALAQHQKKLIVEEALISSGLSYTILQPAHFMQTLQYRAAFEERVFRLTWSLERRQSLVDLEDVTDIAATILASPQIHAGATYELSSGDCLTAYEIADIIADITGGPIAAHEVKPEQVIEKVFGRGMDPALFQQRVRLFETVARWYSEHDFVGSPNIAAMLLGRAPNGFRTFAEREHAAWLGPRAT